MQSAGMMFTLRVGTDSLSDVLKVSINQITLFTELYFSVTLLL